MLLFFNIYLIAWQLSKADLGDTTMNEFVAFLEPVNIFADTSKVLCGD